MPILEELTQIASAMVADSDGREYLLMRTEQGWLTRLTDAQRWKDQAQWSRWAGTGGAVETWQQRLDYDPRSRPWYRGAADSVGQQQVFWTAPYRFFTRQVPGITAASHWRHPSGQEKILVVAFDVLLTDISALTMALSSTAKRRTFILSGQGQILGIPGDPQMHDSGALEASVPSAAESFPLAIVRDTYAQWLSRGQPAGEPFVFESDGAVWWAGLWDYPLGNQSLWLAVAVPEVALVEHLDGPGHALPASIAGVGILIFLTSLMATRRYRGGTEAADQSQSAKAFDALWSHADKDSAETRQQLLALIEAGENERLEFKSSVRWNFKAGRTGKEMELAWLKTVVAFLNSVGGIILLGVDDSGEILGLGKDGFANDDQSLRHVENLIARHIGSSYFPYIRSRLISVQDKQVLMILCKPSAKPVFLTHDKGEDFYIRTGPASRSLAPSEVLAYTQTRPPR
jgi:hypothetical protein